MTEAARRARGSRHGSAVLREDQAAEVFKLAHAGTYSLREIGKKFGVSKGTVQHIKQKIIWRHLHQDVETRAL
jgi:DNA invertase Pin-like site-specific DNA recombinase